MVETDAAATGQPLLPGVHRLIRVLNSDEGPYAGSLVTSGTSVAVAVDGAELADWPGWRFGDSEHVAAPVDLVRRADGHDVLLPWCTERVSVFLGRRRAAGMVLSAGEVGTLVASVVRGLRELGDDARTAQGEWWLAHDSRPLFVHGAGATAREAADAVLALVIADVTDRALSRVLTEIAAGVVQPRITSRDEQRWEDELFHIAAPRALRTEVFAPERVREMSARPVDGLELQPVRGAGARRRERRAIGATLAAVSGAAAERWRTIRAARGPKAMPGAAVSRRRPLLLGGTAAAAVLGVGLLWPAEAAQQESADPPPMVDAPSASESAPPGTPTPETRTADPAESSPPRTDPAETDSAETDTAESDTAKDDAVENDTADTAAAAVPTLLDRIAVCAAKDDPVCAGAIAAGAAMPTDGLILRGSESATVTPVDDYGDLAVVRLTAVEAQLPDQMLVLVRQNDEWLVRDVYDVADQPE